jgi:hypothetical protein
VYSIPSPSPSTPYYSSSPSSPLLIPSPSPPPPCIF